MARHSEKKVDSKSRFNLGQTEFLKPLKSQEKRGLLKKSGVALASAAAAGFILSGSEYNAPEGLDDIVNIGLTPTPEVSTSGTKSMIEANDGLRDYSPIVLGLGLAGMGIYEYRRRQDNRLHHMHNFTHQDSHWVRIALAGGIMGTIASASGLGDTAADNASEPIQRAAALYGAEQAITPVFTSYEGALGNHMPVDYANTATAVSEAGGTPMPLIFELGKVEDPTSLNNPTSGPIVGVPNESLNQAFNIDMPAIENCDDMSIIVGEQLGVDTGDTVKINGRPATVASTIDVKPGLGRVMALGSVEQLDKCVYPDSLMLIANGLELPQRGTLDKINNQLDTEYVARSFEELIEENQEFWDGSVKPSQMNLIFQQLGLGAAGIAILQGMQIANRRKKLAVRLSRDVPKSTLTTAEFLASERDVIRSIPIGLGVYTLFTYMINSTQHGMSQSIDIPSIASGYSVTAIAAGATSAAATYMMTRRINVHEELGSSA